MVIGICGGCASLRKKAVRRYVGGGIELKAVEVCVNKERWPDLTPHQPLCNAKECAGYAKRVGPALWLETKKG